MHLHHQLNKPHLISVAPMMGYTDRHARYFLRLIAPDVQLYTEMITAQALVYGDVKRLLSFHPSEKNVVLQVGGNDPLQLAHAAKLGEAFGYDEINLNCGCPSPRVSSGRFGACLMFEPTLVATCVAAMRQETNIPITVKCRIGVDEKDDYASLQRFITAIAATGCDTFIIHARKAWLSGLSPKENRDIPPLRYEVVYQLKQDFPNLNFILNGGLKSLADIQIPLTKLDGVMIGRAAYANPYLLAELQKHYYPTRPVLSRQEIIHQYLTYVETQLTQKIKLTTLIKPILELFKGQPGAAAWRRHLSSYVHLPDKNINLILQALSFVN